MKTRFVQIVNDGTVADFSAQGLNFAYLSPAEQEQVDLLQKATAWQVRCFTTGTFYHDEYGDYDLTDEESFRTLAGMTSLSQKQKLAGLIGDIIVENGQIVGIVIWSGQVTNRYGKIELVPIDPASFTWPSHAIGPSKGELLVEFSVLFTNGTTLGTCQTKHTEWESRGIRHTTTTWSLVKAES